MDTATQLLLRQLANCRGPVLWFADEQVDREAASLARARTDLHAISNRCDVVAALNEQGVAATLSDFVLPTAPAYTTVLFRVAKEKALVHHIINAALEHVPSGGALLLSGRKDEGIKTYIEKAARRAGGTVELVRDGGALLGAIVRGAELSERLDDQNYAQLRELTFAPDLAVWSKPGIFGWKKIDEGSRFLFEHVDRVWPKAPQRVLDLGCGYGYLSVLALRRWSQVNLVATDNNIVAVAACSRNLLAFGARAECVCSDAGATIASQFDAILCNPPFHQGFVHADELTEKFLRQTRRLLTRGGRALFVVNQFIAIERVAQPLFARVETIARNQSFKLIVLERGNG